MRQVATFEDERNARLFADVLCAREIETDVSHSRAGSWDVWVHEERHVEGARAAFAAFDANPGAPEHLQAAGCVDRKLRAQEVTERKSRHEVIDVRRRMPNTESRFGRTTLSLVFVSVAVTLVVTLGRREEIADLLFIGLGGDPFPFFRIVRGEVWRLITPIFIHMNVLHILFNMWWLVDLGSALESRIGAARYAFLVLATGVLSNAAQYLLVGSPYFGGMSGVLYALFGYVWIRGRLDPTIGLAMPNATIVALLVWLVMGFTGLLGNTANIAHLGGLVSGAAFGAVAAVLARRK